MALDSGPLPPTDFLSRDPRIEVVPRGASFVRIHRSALGALHFGMSGDNRFDDPERHYGVCYAARSLEGAFAETCLREVGARLVSLSGLAARSVTTLRAETELRLVELHGPGLARLGATAAVTSGTYDISQPWSRALYVHPAAVDGIVYRSNHDNGELCVALFDRCRHRLAAEASEEILSDRAALGRLLEAYRVGLA
jgi:hypothetical protein